MSGTDEFRWAVVDVETTGLYPSTDRVIEIAVVRLDQDGRQLDSWTTLLQPNRDIGPTSIHGITSRDVMGAPTFGQIAPELLWRLGGHVPVGHNVRFDLRFLTGEFQRIGMDFSTVEGICTMALADRMGAGRSLRDCCESFRVSLANHHTALADAEATGAIFRQMRPAWSWGNPSPLPLWGGHRSAVPVRLRSDPPLPRVAPGAATLGSRVGIPNDSTADRGAVVAYLGLLDRVLEDRVITDDEVAALSWLSCEWGIGAAQAEELNRAYVAGARRLAQEDGIVTAEELRDIETLAELLGVPVDQREVPAIRLEHASRASEFVGKSVCFTGESDCLVEGLPLRREDQQRLAEGAGMVVKTGVSGRLDVLVLADPDSRSGKSKKADELGVRKMAEPDFWRALGLECQVGYPPASSGQLHEPREGAWSLEPPMSACVKLVDRSELLAEDLAGKSVCFTGGSVCMVDGLPLQRSDQERLAQNAGMVTKSAVSGQLDLLVLANPASHSEKSRRADALGVRKMAESDFWRLLGLDCHTGPRRS